MVDFQIPVMSNFRLTDGLRSLLVIVKEPTVSNTADSLNCPYIARTSRMENG